LPAGDRSAGSSTPPLGFRVGLEVMVMKFVVKQGSTGQFRFNLVASIGQLVATSEGYTRKASALETIASIQKNAGGAAIEDETTDD
jgi:uncharacterized protein